jgi:hypothetical protein
MASTALRPSPMTPRSLAFQDVSADNSPGGRRRSSITESNSGFPPRTSSYRQSNLSYGQSRTYNSSPLVPRSAEPQRADTHHNSDGTHGVEGTESTGSTTAPSTVWDELDDIKSRIHRLELTGKLPSTSGAAISRLSDERPPTATTQTTMSTSPKRGSGNSAAQGDASSTTSSQKDGHPILQAAVNKARPFLTAEVFKALEAAATDALTLSSMMGTVGQPGPISSGASTIGGLGTVTDRQLRRKADSVCRSLTELCLALSEEAAQPKTVQTNGTPQKDSHTPTTPTINKPFAGLAAQRRPSAVAEQNLVRPNTSPRAMTRLEERRTSLLNGTALPSPRFGGATPSAQLEPVGRKSSLLISRARRAGTEEPDEGRKSSLLLRTRRAGTEEPEEGRKTSLLLRGRRGTVGEDDDEARFRAPSRAATEVASSRVVSQPPAPDTVALGQSALPRRRLVPSTLNSRLIAPTPAANPTRRYLDRPTPEREGNSVADKLAEDRGQRQMSLGQAVLLNRTGSLNRRQQNRESTITNVSTTASAGGYR